MNDFDFIVMNMEATDVFQSKTIYAIYKMNAELIFKTKTVK